MSRNNPAVIFNDRNGDDKQNGFRAGADDLQTLFAVVEPVVDQFQPDPARRALRP
jgi:hypothetical protein